MAGARWRPHQLGVRASSCLASVAVMVVALVVVAGGLLLLLRTSLEHSADAAAAARADQVAATLRDDSPTAQDLALVSTVGDVRVVQILNARGAILLASPGTPATPLAPALPDRTGMQRTEVQVPGFPGGLRVIARGVSGPGGVHTVVVAVGDESVTATLSTVASLLAVGLPLIVVVVGVATYVVVGRSLRPVERMRARAAEISGTADLSERLPVPTPRDEITSLAVTLNSMLARLEAGHETRRRFVGDASHELRSPLATLTAALELARDRPSALDRELVRVHLLPEAQRMQRLLDDLLMLARADENQLTVDVRDVDLDDLLDREVTRLRDRTGVQVDATIAPARVRGDVDQLVRVIRNLTDNAVRHARRRIEVTGTVSDGKAVLTVGDDGPGIPEDQREQVLRRFVRLDADRARSGGGSGLGLAIAGEIVAAHGGTLVVGGSAAGGALFTVSLPCDDPPYR